MATRIQMTLDRPKVSEEDVRDPTRLRAKLDRAYEEITSLHARIGEVAAQIAAAPPASATALTQPQADLLTKLSIDGASGYLTIPTTNGAPSGQPSAVVAGTPALIDPAARKLWAYFTGVGWKSVDFI